MFQGMGLVLFLADLLAITFASERFFYALLLAWLQIKRVALDFLDDVFSLHLALKAAQGILKGFAFLNSNLCQEKYTSKQSPNGMLSGYSLFSGDLRQIGEKSWLPYLREVSRRLNCRICFEEVPPPRDYQRKFIIINILLTTHLDKVFIINTLQVKYSF
jgi:hypothetical protein